MKSPSCTVYVGLAQARPNNVPALSIMPFDSQILIRLFKHYMVSVFCNISTAVA